MIKKNENGMILVVLIGLITAFSIIGLALLSYVTSQYSRTRNNVFTANTTQAAEAGIEQSLYQINQNESFTGYSTDQVFFDNATQGKGVFSSVVTQTADSNAKTITSTAKVYRQSNLTKPVSIRKIKVTIVGTASEGYSVQTGPGGLILGGSANITNSDVYVNGKITLTGSAKIGTNSQPVDVKVANYSCPTTTNPGSAYPSLCSSTEPISLAYSTYIYGNVCATGQTSRGPNPSGNILPGSGGQGLIAGCVAPKVDPPTYDRATHIAAMTTTSTGTNNTYTCQSYPFDRTWPSKLKLTGNVTIDGSCNVVIKGNAYITGDFNLGGAAKMTVDDSLGATRPVIVVDGKITVGGSARILANSSGTGAQFISYKSSASCSPSCSTVTGTDLKNSSALETVSIGGAVSMPGMIFQAYWGKITVAGSGNVGAAAGQTVDLSGAGTITFGTILSSGSRSWTVTSYQQVFN